MPERWAVWLQPWQGAESDHRAAAARAAIERWRGDCFVGGSDHRRRSRNGEQLPAQCQLCHSVAVGKEAIMTDAMKAVRQGVEQEATDELVGMKGKKLRLTLVAIIFPTEGDVGVGHADQARVCDGDAVCVSTEIGQHLSGSAEGRLGVDHPIDPPKHAQSAGENRGPRKFGKITETAKIAAPAGGADTRAEQTHAPAT